MTTPKVYNLTPKMVKKGKTISVYVQGECVALINITKS